MVFHFKPHATVSYSIAHQHSIGLSYMELRPTPKTSMLLIGGMMSLTSKNHERFAHTIFIALPRLFYSLPGGHGYSGGTYGTTLGAHVKEGRGECIIMRRCVGAEGRQGWYWWW